MFFFTAFGVLSVTFCFVLFPVENVFPLHRFPECNCFLQHSCVHMQYKSAAALFQSGQRSVYCAAECHLFEYVPRAHSSCFVHTFHASRRRVSCFGMNCSGVVEEIKLFQVVNLLFSES